MNKQFLHLGCGHLRKDRSTPEFRTDKWDEVRVDIDSNVDPDIEATMTDLSVIEDKSYDAIYSSHNIEHLYAHEVELARERGSVTSKSNYILPKEWERGLRNFGHFLKVKSHDMIQSL